MLSLVQGIYSILDDLKVSLQVCCGAAKPCKGFFAMDIGLEYFSRLKMTHN